MANLNELPTWDAGVYRLETTDPAEGGESGKANAPLKNLANRTTYLKSRVDTLEAATSMAAHVAAPDPHPVYTTAAELSAAISAAGVGLGQTWQDVTGSRAVSTSYQNATGKPIVVDVEAYGNYGGTTNVQLSLFVSVNGSTWVEFKTNLVVGTAGSWNKQLIIPNGHYYKFTHSGQSYQVRELR